MTIEAGRRALLCAVIALMSFPGATLAQSLLDFGEAEIGLRTGINRSEFWNTGDFSEPFEPRLRWFGGVVARLPLKGRVFVQAELAYSRKGAERPTREREISGGRIDAIPGARLSTSYLEVPILVAVPTISLGEDRRLNVFGGGAVAVLLGCRYSQAGFLSGDQFEDDWPEWGCEDGPPSRGLPPRASAFQEIRSLDWSAIVGFGIPLPVGSPNAALDVRYALALRDLESRGADHRNEHLQVGVTLLW